MGGGGGGACWKPLVQTLSMEREAMRLLTILCHRRPAVHTRVRELDGLATVLQRCQLDARNPQIREWARPHGDRAL